jgi:ABC-type nitrate/sulfonate/bicarbonate transport system ATPase subunit
MEYQLGKLLLKADLSLSFKGKSILRGIGFEVYDTIQVGAVRGQVVAILGPSGIGKTQLFRCIAGLQIPTEGAVYVNDDQGPVEEGEVGVVAQDYPLLETRTVLGNLVRAVQISRKIETKFFGRVIKLPVKGEEARRLSMEYLERFGLAAAAQQYPCQLSGGQRQRVAIIQQMLCSKHFLLMDEPFSGLDIIAKDKAIKLITQMASADELNTIIITTHDIRSACAAADRVILLGHERDQDGNIIPGARVLADLDLKAADLCWIPGITTTPKFLEFVAEVERQFHEL